MLIAQNYPIGNEATSDMLTYAIVIALILIALTVTWVVRRYR